MYHDIVLGTDPEIPILNEDNRMVPASELIEAFMHWEGINVGDRFAVQDGNGREALYHLGIKTVTINHRDYETFLLKGLESSTGHTLPDILVDGANLEMNIPPSSCRETMLRRIGTGFSVIQKILDRVSDAQRLRVSAVPTVVIDEDTLKNLPSVATVFGCDPDIDVHGMVECKWVDASEYPYRHAGGHIHMSLPSLENPMEWYAENMVRLTRTLDRLVGLAYIAISSSPLEDMRRKMYGQAGRIRLQPYGGLEYRTPSNVLVLHPSIASYLFLWTQVAHNVVMDDNLFEELEATSDFYDVIYAINTGNSSLASDLLKESFNLLKDVPNLSKEMGHSESSLMSFSDNLTNLGGAYAAFNPNDVSETWGVEGMFPMHGSFNSFDFDQVYIS